MVLTNKRFSQLCKRCVYQVIYKPPQMSKLQDIKPCTGQGLYSYLRGYLDSKGRNYDQCLIDCQLILTRLSPFLRPPSFYCNV